MRLDPQDRPEVESSLHSRNRRRACGQVALLWHRARGMPQPAAHDALPQHAHCKRKRDESQVERQTLATKVKSFKSAAVASASAR